MTVSLTEVTGAESRVGDESAVFYDFASQGGSDWHLFVGREKGACKTPDANVPLRIRTTRRLTRTNGVWRQLHHHGSIEEPAMLADYQRAIFGAPLGRPA